MICYTEEKLKKNALKTFSSFLQRCRDGGGITVLIVVSGRMSVCNKLLEYPKKLVHF